MSDFLADLYERLDKLYKDMLPILDTHKRLTFIFGIEAIEVGVERKVHELNSIISGLDDKVDELKTQDEVLRRDIVELNATIDSLER